MHNRKTQIISIVKTLRGMANKWDSKELVTDRLLERQHVKDVKSASQRLLDYSPKQKFAIDSKAQQNPIYRQSVYGGMRS